MLNAQDDNSDNEVYDLSPFVVEADDDIGYLAISTLAGTRLRTDFKDIGASIDVMTMEFLDDVGAVTVDESFIYTAHLENPYETGQDSANGPGSGSSDLSAGGGNRALGLTSPTLSRNYFGALLPLDRYNTERVTIARGPQAILFGLGSPSGVVNVNMTRAQFNNNFLEARTRFDNWGSRRWEIGLNQTILDNTLAIRLAYLDDRQQFWLDPGWDDRIRKYGTLTWKPLKRVSIRLHHESMKREASVPGTQLPRDKLSYFYEGNDGELIDGYNPSGGNPFWVHRGPAGVSALFNFDGQAEPVFMEIQGQAIPRRTARIVSMVSDPNSKHYNPEDPLFDPDWIQLDDAIQTLTLKDETYYPVFKKHLVGELRPTEQEGDYTTAFLEVHLFDDLSLFSDGFVELAYNKAAWEQLRGGMFSGQEFALGVDVNRFLPNGEVNPNAGKQFITSFGGWIERDDRRSETVRLTASMEMDLTGKRHWLGFHRFGCLLEDSEVESDRQGAIRTIGNIGGVLGGKNPEAYTGAPMVGPGGNWAWGPYGRILAGIFYLEEEKGVLYPTADMIPWGDPLDTWQVPTPEGTFGIYGLDPDGPGAWRPPKSVLQGIETASVSWQGWFDIGDLARLVTTYGYRTDRVRTKERISPDSFTNSFGETLTIGPDGRIKETNLYPHYSLMPWSEEWGPTGKNSNDVIGAVVHFQPAMDRIFNGALRGSLNFNKSSNNTPMSASYDIGRVFHSGQRGEGENYGGKLEFAQSKYVLSVNRWTVDLIGAGAPSQASRVRYDVSRMEQRWIQVEPDWIETIVSATGGYLADPDDDLGSINANAYGVYSDQKANGWVFDFAANPVRGLRVRANLGKTWAVQSHVASSWIRFIRETRRPVWESEIQWWDDSDADGTFRPVLVWDPNLEVDLDGNGVADTREDGDSQLYLTLGDPDNPSDVANILSGWENIAMSSDDLDIPESIRDRYLNEIEGNHLLVAEGYEGLSNPTIREWRANATATYTFYDGPLLNCSLGGSIRYRDEQFIGAAARLVDLTLADGASVEVVTEDPSKPLYGEDFWFFDLMVGYDGSFSVRGHRIDFGLQVNIRNLLNEDGTYTTDATSTGRPVRVSRNIPREVFLSASFRY